MSALEENYLSPPDSFVYTDYTAEDRGKPGCPHDEGCPLAVPCGDGCGNEHDMPYSCWCCSAVCTCGPVGKEKEDV